MIQIDIRDKIEYYPVWVNNTFEGRINSVTEKITWEPSLFSNIQDCYTEQELIDIEILIIKQFKLIKEYDSEQKRG